MLEQVLLGLTGLLRPYISHISLMLLATILVIYGDVLNKQIKRCLARLHFVLRTLGFVAICAFGYGAFIVFCTPFVNRLLLALPAMYLGGVIVGLFILLGTLAEKRRYI